MTKSDVELLLNFLSMQFGIGRKEVTKLVHEYTKADYTDDDIWQERYEAFNKWLKENYPNVSQMKRQCSFDEFVKLRTKYTFKNMEALFNCMENWRDLCKKNNSVYLTFINWATKYDK